jgi:ubiquinone/menaquinone biosynthesis C-methylase UbiE
MLPCVRHIVRAPGQKRGRMTAASNPMNSWSDEDAIVDYYDSDFPADGDPAFGDAYSRAIGWGIDERFYSFRAKTAARTLELCCGSGRISTALAATGTQLTCVDFSKSMLRRLHDRFARSAHRPYRIEEQDVRRLSLGEREFDLVVLPFNGLANFASYDDQLHVLRVIRSHLKGGGRLVMDSDNAFHVPAGGQAPSLAFHRRHVTRGNLYGKWLGYSPLSVHQTFTLHGWYDEIEHATGCVRRSLWEYVQRLVTPSEIRMMCELAGFTGVRTVDLLEGRELHYPLPRFGVEAVVPP